MRVSLTALFVLLSLHGAAAQTLSASNDLHPVEEMQRPWSSIAVINNSVHGRCTGVLLAADIVLTAAHCLYNRRTGVFVRPQSVHVLLGFKRGAYAFHTTVAEVTLGDKYDPAASDLSLASDFAILRLVESAPPAFSPMTIASATETGRAVVAAGYAQQRPQVLTRTSPCTITGRTERGLIVSDCAVQHGLSGGPLIDEASGELVGIQIAMNRVGGTPSALSIPASWVSKILAARPR